MTEEVLLSWGAGTQVIANALGHLLLALSKLTVKTKYYSLKHIPHIKIELFIYGQCPLNHFKWPERF